MTFSNVFWLEFTGVSILFVVFLLATVVFKYLQLVEAKLGGAIILITILVAIVSVRLWEAHPLNAAMYAFGAMFISGAVWVIVILGASILVERLRNRL